MKKLLMITATLLMLGGCAEYQAVKGTALMAAERAADTSLNDGLFVVCRATTVGAWERKFGSSQDAIDGWRKLCQPQNQGAPRE